MTQIRSEKHTNGSMNERDRRGSVPKPGHPLMTQGRGTNRLWGGGASKKKKL